MATGKLKIDIRRQKILDYLKKNGQASVALLSQELNVSPVTIRNDLDTLAKDGHLLRVQGGAITNNQPIQQLSSSITGSESFLEEKRRIANAALSYIQNNDTLFINSGSTSRCVAETLVNLQYLNVVTNSLDVARYLSTVPSFHVVLLGGELNAEHGFTYGADAINQLSSYRSSWAILSVDSIRAESGITTHYPEEVLINRTMIEHANRTIIVADHRKINCNGFSKVCDIHPGQILITSSSPSECSLLSIQEKGMEICLV